MKEPLYPVEITQEVLKELKDEKMYHIIYSDGGGESWSGAWIKGHVDVNCISIIYLPLSSTPLKQLSDEEIKDIAHERYTNLPVHRDICHHFQEGMKTMRDLLIVSPQSDHINPIELLEWVDVKERLPENKQRILFITVLGNEIRCGIFLEEDQWKRHNIFCDGAFFGTLSVSHWMPLPAPPKI